MAGLSLHSFTTAVQRTVAPRSRLRGVASLAAAVLLLALVLVGDVALSALGDEGGSYQASDSMPRRLAQNVWRNSRKRWRRRRQAFQAFVVAAHADALQPDADFSERAYRSSRRKEAMLRAQRAEAVGEHQTNLMDDEHFTVNAMEVLAASPPPLVMNGSLESGNYSLANYTLEVYVPNGGSDGTVYPVLILLHGGNITAAETVYEWQNIDIMSTVFSSHIVVVPDGPTHDWNVWGEESTLDDAGFVGTVLIDTLAGATNVQQDSFRLYGSSNGGALVNRILIENADIRITHALTESSELATFQFHDASFFIGGADDSYTTKQPTLFTRHVMLLVGGDDTRIPPAGGLSCCLRGINHTLEQFLSWRDSAFRYAQAYGYEGPAAGLAQSDATLKGVTYLDGLVQAQEILGVGHHVTGFAEDDADASVIAGVEAANRLTVEFLTS